MKIKSIVLTTLILLSSSAIAAVDCPSLAGKSHKATIIKVADGDTATVRLENNGTTVNVRFFGIDTPESKWKDHWKAQHYSAEAKYFTINELQNKKVTVEFSGDETYSRCVGEIFVNGQSHSLALVKGGYAWWYAKYSQNRSDIQRAQASAKHSKIGLWKNPKAIAPWLFRRKHK
ncbi:MAG: micrococcal nuclease [Colwellia sp.]|jgi:endonuclease YncB( thermonuclease family)